MSDQLLNYYKENIPWLNTVNNSIIIYLHKEYMDDTQNLYITLDISTTKEAKYFSNYLNYCLTKDNPFINAFLAKKDYETKPKTEFIYW